MWIRFEHSRSPLAPRVDGCLCLFSHRSTALHYTTLYSTLLGVNPSIALFEWRAASIKTKES